MKVSYDSKNNEMYVQIVSSENICQTIHHAIGDEGDHVLVDYNGDGHIVGIELLGVIGQAINVEEGAGVLRSTWNLFLILLRKEIKPGIIVHVPEASRNDMDKKKEAD